MFEQISDAEKKQFFQSFVNSIEIDPNPASKKRVLKHIEFRFPVSYDAEEGQILLRTENDVETAVCLYHQKKDFISALYEPKDAGYLNQLK